MRERLSDEELSDRVHQWIVDLCSQKRSWVMSIPARPDHDPDILISEMRRRFDAMCAAVRKSEMEGSDA